MSLAENLIRLREERGIRQIDLARAAGIRQSLLTQIETGKVRSTKKVYTLARALGVRPHELDPGIPDVPDDATLVPIVSWVSAGALKADDEPTDVLGTITVQGLSDRGEWIALRVEGDSMDRISPPNSIIVIDTNDRKLVLNACYVIADADGGATYKRFRSPPARFEPVSTNPVHEPIYPDGEPRIIGRVRKTILDL